MIADLALREWFPTETARAVLDLDHDAIAKHTIDFMDLQDSYTTYHDYERNQEWQKHPEVQKLMVDILEATKQYMDKTSRKPWKQDPILFIWANVYKEHDEHGAHIHPRSLVSGTYYCTEDESHSSIRFDSPLINHKMHDTQDIDRSFLSIKPNKGDMLLWPSWLTHRVSAQKKTPIPRVSISFNIDYNEIRKL
jgi:uncharacterized protein (TIGR02466 family)|tara:strand:- start:2433 stop:3014 length:582 start_codon:yes stop_codon:yes gene_type:complete